MIVLPVVYFTVVDWDELQASECEWDNGRAIVLLIFISVFVIAFVIIAWEVRSCVENYYIKSEVSTL